MAVYVHYGALEADLQPKYGRFPFDMATDQKWKFFNFFFFSSLVSLKCITKI